MRQTPVSARISAPYVPNNMLEGELINFGYEYMAKWTEMFCFAIAGIILLRMVQVLM